MKILIKYWHFLSAVILTCTLSNPISIYNPGHRKFTLPDPETMQATWLLNSVTLIGVPAHTEIINRCYHHMCQTIKQILESVTI